MAFGGLYHGETCGFQQRFGRSGDLLAVLQRTRGVVGHLQRRQGLGRGKRQAREVFGDVEGLARDPSGPGLHRVVGKQMAPVLDRRAAARSGGQDRLGPGIQMGGPHSDIVTGKGFGLSDAAHVLGQGAAATLLRDGDDLHPGACQKTDGGGVDAGIQHRLRAALQQHDLALGIGRGRGGLGPWQTGRAKAQHCGKRRGLRQQLGEGSGDAGGDEREAEGGGAGQDRGERGAQHAVGDRALVGRLNMRASGFQQVAIVHARGAGGGAGEATEAAVEMQGDLRVGGAALFEHVLDQRNASTWAVEFIAERHVSRAGRRAEPTVDAGAQDRFRLGHAGLRQSFRGEVRLHL